MKIQTQVQCIFSCSIERAFKTPMLCDISAVHRGYGFLPRATHCTDDETWGRIGGSRMVHFASTQFNKKGAGALDTIIDRIENKYWKIEVTEFEMFAFGFNKFIGEWETEKMADGQIRVVYTYNLVTQNILAYPFQWLFTKIIWRAYMKHVIRIIKQLAEDGTEYVHD